MATLLLILSILGAIPKVIELFQEIWTLIEDRPSKTERHALHDQLHQILARHSSKERGLFDQEKLHSELVKFKVNIEQHDKLAADLVDAAKEPTPDVAIVPQDAVSEPATEQL